MIATVPIVATTASVAAGVGFIFNGASDSNFIYCAFRFPVGIQVYSISDKSSWNSLNPPVLPPVATSNQLDVVATALSNDFNYLYAFTNSTNNLNYGVVVYDISNKNNWNQQSPSSLNILSYTLMS